MYDVEGSIAGIEQIQTEELPIVHEMGGTLFSERYSTFIRRFVSPAVAQNTSWDVTLSDLPENYYRVIGVSVFTDGVAGEVAFCSLAMARVDGPREIPIWIFDATNDTELRVRFSSDGAAAAQTNFLRPVTLLETLPHLSASAGQPQSVPNIVFRGTSAAFGAGTVVATALIHVAFVAVAGVSSRGVPMPSW